MLMYDEKHALYISSLVLPTLRAYVCGNLKSTPPQHEMCCAPSALVRVGQTLRRSRPASNQSPEEQTGSLEAQPAHHKREMQVCTSESTKSAMVIGYVTAPKQLCPDTIGTPVIG